MCFAIYFGKLSGRGGDESGLGEGNQKVNAPDTVYKTGDTFKGSRNGGVGRTLAFHQYIPLTCRDAALSFFSNSVGKPKAPALSVTRLLHVHATQVKQSLFIAFIN